MRWKKRKKDRLSGEILLLSEHIQNELLTKYFTDNYHYVEQIIVITEATYFPR